MTNDFNLPAEYPSQIPIKIFVVPHKTLACSQKRRRDFVSAIKNPFCTFSVNASHHFHIHFETNRKQKNWDKMKIDFWQILEGNQNMSCSKVSWGRNFHDEF